ncbi:MAG: hypothetical protein AB1427_05150 [Thermodesulfobacteriota bacterium]
MSTDVKYFVLTAIIPAVFSPLLKRRTADGAGARQKTGQGREAVELKKSQFKELRTEKKQLSC